MKCSLIALLRLYIRWLILIMFVNLHLAILILQIIDKWCIDIWQLQSNLAGSVWVCWLRHWLSILSLGSWRRGLSARIGRRKNHWCLTSQEPWWTASSMSLIHHAPRWKPFSIACQIVGLLWLVHHPRHRHLIGPLIVMSQQFDFLSSLYQSAASSGLVCLLSPLLRSRLWCRDQPLERVYP